METTEQLKIENFRQEPVALITAGDPQTEAMLRQEITRLNAKLAGLESRLNSLPGMEGHNALISRLTNLHNQNEFMSKLLTMFIRAAQWPKVSSKMVGEMTEVVRSLGKRGRNTVSFLEKFELALRDLEKYQDALTKNGAEGGINEG